MKRIFSVALILATVTLSKQVNAQQGFSVSIKAAPQVSFLQNKDDRNNNSIEQKATFNTNFGVGAGYNFTDKLGVGMDVLYSLQGQRKQINGITTNQRLDYVKIPVYFTYVANPSRPVSFIGKVGPQLSLLTDAKLKDSDGNTLKSNTKDFYKDATFGGMAAAGVKFKLDRSLYLTTMARFDYDFTNAEDHNNSFYPSGRAKTYNMTTGLEIGVKYMQN